MFGAVGTQVPAWSQNCISRLQVDEEDKEWEEEFLSEKDPSILHFLIASGDDITSKQLRDDLMTMLVAGHETTAAVLTWTLYLLAQVKGAKAITSRRGSHPCV
jgi:cytochrome P450